MKKLLALVSVLTYSTLHLQAQALDPLIVAGRNHTLILRTNGTVFSYGLNDFGQLGDNTTIDRASEVQVTNLNSVTAISAGATHSLALSNGFVYAWGCGTSGRLGNGSSAHKYVPTKVTGLSNIIAVAAGGNFSLALQTNGPTNRVVWAWGGNDKGQLGNGTYTSSTTPVQVNVSDTKLIAAGDRHALSYSDISINGSFFDMIGWGDSPGNGMDPADWTDNTDPILILYSEGVVYPLLQLACGESSSYALDSAGQIWALGGNGYGQLGDGSNVPAYSWSYSGIASEAVLVGVIGAESIAAGDHHGLAVLTNGQVWAWGANSFGCLGDGSLNSQWSPVQVSNTGDTGGNSNIFSVAGGGAHSVALALDGTNGKPVGWGHYNNGQLGIGKFDFRSTNGSANVSNATAVAAGNENNLVLSNNVLVSWGNNGSGQCGDGTTIDRASPVPVNHAPGVYLQSVSSFAVGTDHSLAISNGIVWAWGYGAYGRIGDGHSSSRHNPVQVTNLTDVTNVSAFAHSLAVRGSDGSVWAWGPNGSGQLGIGNLTTQTTPQQVTNTTGSPLVGFSRVAAGGNHSLALSNNLVWAWGDGFYGQLGMGSTNDYTNAVQISGSSLSGVSAIAAGDDHSLALSNTTIYAWGYNASGQLGLGDTTKRLTPVAVGSGYTNVVAGKSHTIAIKTNGTVWVWGLNSRGQLGLGNTTTYKVPTQVPGISNVVAVAAGSEHSIIVTSDGRVLTSGDTTQGQLGIGDIGYTTTLVPVP